MSTDTLAGKSANEKDVQNLVNNLSQQFELFDEIIDLGLKQRQALVNHNLEDSQSINKQQDEVALRLENLEKNRIILSRKILGNSANNSDNARGIKCENLYPMMSRKQTEWVEEWRQRLLGKVMQSTQLNNINAALIQNGLNLNLAKLEIMSSLASKTNKPNNKIYGSEGRTENIQKEKFHFLNKRV